MAYNFILNKALVKHFKPRVRLLYDLDNFSAQLKCPIKTFYMTWKTILLTSSC